MTRDPTLNALIAREIATAALDDAKRRACTRDIHAAQEALQQATHALLGAE